MVKISIVMPIFNASEHLENACLSVYNQSIKDIELICINDGSTDNSSEILEDLEKKYDFIKIINQHNQGSGNARNRGIVEATGDYIAFLDADDVFLDSNALEVMFECAYKNDANMVSANLKRINLDRTIDEKYDYRNTSYKYFDKTGIILPSQYGIPFAFYKNIFKKDFLINNGIQFPNLLRGQDPIFLVNILKIIDEIYVVDVDLYGYNSKTNGGLNSKIDNYSKKLDYIKHYKITLDILKENGFDYSYEEYKKEFIKYITYGDNILDVDIKNIVFKVFGDITEYFDENDFGYPYIEMLHNDIQQVEELNDELNEYKLIKECLFNETLICDNFVNPNYLRKYLQIKEDYVSENNKLEQLSFVSLKKTEKDLNNRTNLLERNVKKLTRDVEEINDSVDAVLSSKSWMITESLRTLKRLYKKS